MDYLRKKHHWEYTYTLIPVFSFLGYATIRYHQEPWQYIGIAGGFNIIEQWCGLYLMRFLPHQRDTFPFINRLFLLFGCLLTLTFSFPGSLAIAAYNDTDWPTVFFIYTMSHLSGNFMGLYTLLITEYYWNDLYKIWTKMYVVELIIYIGYISFFNSFHNYGITGPAAILASYPFLSFIATRRNQVETLIADICGTIIIFLFTILRRGPFWYNSNYNTIELVFSLYTFVLTNSLLSSYISIGTQQLKSSLLKISNLKDEIIFIFSHISHDIRIPIMHLQDVLYQINEKYGESITDNIQECEDVIDVMDVWLLALHNTSGEDIVLLKPTISSMPISKFIYMIDRKVHIMLTMKDVNHDITYTSSYKKDDVVQTDWKMIHCIVQNLCSNSVKYTTKGDICLHINVENENMIIKVIDTGNGMSLEMVNSLFDFNKPKALHNVDRMPRSHGIGMHIIYKFVQILKGEIHIESVIGKGSTFTITVPIRYGMVEISIHSSPPLKRDITNIISNLSILLAEDDSIMISLIQRMLVGCKKLTMVKNGSEVLPNISNHDVLLLDGNLLDSIQAEDILQSLKEYSQPIFIVIISGREVTIPTDFPHPIIVCSKPFSKPILMDKLCCILNKEN
jgi:signal transduction histidine kinase